MGKIKGSVLLIIGIFWIGIVIFTNLFVIESYRGFLGESSSESSFVSIVAGLTVAIPGIVLTIFGIKSIILK